MQHGIVRISLVFASLLLLSSVLFAEPGKDKGNGKGSDPVNKFRIIQWEAADVTFADNGSDAIQSDGLGTYETFADGFEAYSEYTRTEFISGDRLFFLNLGINVSGDDTVDPSGPIGDVAMYHGVGNVTIEDTDQPFPAPGTTLVSDPDHPQSILFIFMAVDGAGYAIAGDDHTGLVSLTAQDFDGDGKSDRRTIAVDPTFVWTLYAQTTETVTVIVGQGKNREEVTEERVTYVPVAEYTGMPLEIDFDLLGFRVLQFALR